jgi:hypothetical protein
MENGPWSNATRQNAENCIQHTDMNFSESFMPAVISFHWATPITILDDDGVIAWEMSR